MDRPKNSDEIASELVEKDNEIIKAGDELDTVLAELYTHKKRVVELTEDARKGKHNLSRMRTEKDILERQYWKSRS